MILQDKILENDPKKAKIISAFNTSTIIVIILFYGVGIAVTLVLKKISAWGKIQMLLCQCY